MTCLSTIQQTCSPVTFCSLGSIGKAPIIVRFGDLFYEFCDEVSILDWAVALQQLVELVSEIATKVDKKIIKLIKSQLQQWNAGLPY